MDNEWWSPSPGEPVLSPEVPSNYSALFNSCKGEDGTVAFGSLENVISNDPISSPYQKDEILRIVSAHAMSDRLTRDNWNIALALLGLAQQGEQKLSLGAVLEGSFPAVNLPVSTDPGPLTTTYFPETDLSWNQTSSSSPTNLPKSGGVWKTSDADIENYDPTANPTIQVRLVPQREGIFMFRHVVYSIEGSYQLSRSAEPTVFKVVRRYSDFVWLIPNLPPKRLTLDGKYLSSDDYFLERRRRGLSRFLDQIMKHPIIRKENFIVMFLTVDADMSSFRKQALMQISDEMANRVVSPAFIQSWNEEEQMSRWKSIFQSTDILLANVKQLCHSVDRQCKRQEAMSDDFRLMSACYNRIFETAGTSVFEGGEDLPAITEGLRTASKKTTTASELFKDESRGLDAGLLEDLKQFRDLLAATKEIFIRYGRLGKNNIVQLENRVTSNTARVKQFETDETRKGEVIKIKGLITKDRAAIQYEKNRSWLIRQCITEELAICRRVQYQISKFLRDWSLDCTKYAELHSDNWMSLNNEVSELPLPT